MRTAKLAFLMFIVMICITIIAFAQDNPPVNIPTATPSSEQLVQSLDKYGLQPDDLPSHFMALPGNALLMLDEWVALLQADFPDQVETVSQLDSLYQSYGVVGVSLAGYAVETCEGQSVLSVETWILLLRSPLNAALMAANAALPDVYQSLWGWQETSLFHLPGRIYKSPVAGEMCDQPSSQYRVEYPVDEFIVMVSVSALDTTDPALVESVLSTVIELVNGRIHLGDTPPVAIFTNRVNVRQGPGTVFNPPIGGFLAGESAEILAFNLDDTWLKVRYGDTEGWVFAQLATIEGDTRQLPRESGPPLPVVRGDFGRLLVTAVPEGVDSDLDSIPDAQDNCPFCYNPGQEDNNGDGIGNVCESSTCSLNQEPPPPPQATNPPQHITPMPTPTRCVPPFCPSTPPFLMSTATTSP